MNRNKIYRILSCIMMAVIVLCTVDIKALADDIELPTLGDGLVMERYDDGLISDDVEYFDFDLEEMQEYTAEYYQYAASASDIDYWESFDTEYYYNQLKNDTEREFWKGLEASCDKVLYTDAEVTSIRNVYGTELVALRGFSGNPGSTEYYAFMNRADEILRLFYASNPQYYFIKNGYSGAYSGSDRVGYTYYFRFMVYNDFVDITSRNTATDTYKAAIDSAIASINKTDQLGTIKQINDYICNLTDYNNDVINDTVDEETSKSQSAYSCFVYKNTVCSGYAHAAQALCNYFDIDAIEVFNDGHAWNVVKCNDNWYQIDTTWADQKSGIYYGFFMKSYSDYQSESRHIVNDWLTSYIPPATMDSNAYGWVGSNITIPSVTGTVSGSSASVASGGVFQVSLSSAVPGASIYYTLDGSTPDEAKYKCYKYTGPISVSSRGQVNAIQFIVVCDQYLDSDVQSVVYENTERYISAYGSKGKSSAGTIEFDMYFEVDEGTYIDDSVSIKVINSSAEESDYTISQLSSTYSAVDQKYIVAVPATVKPKEMSNICSVQFFSGDVAISEKYETRFASYLYSIMRTYSKDSAEYQVALNLSKLGDASQEYFSYNQSDPIKDYTLVAADTDSSGDSAIVQSLNSYHSSSFKDTSDAMDIIGVSLSLKDRVSVNYYFYVDDDFDLNSFSAYKDKNYKVEKTSDNVVRMTVSDIPYTDAGKIYHYKLYYGSSLAMEIDYSITDYIAAALSNNWTDDSLKTLCRAMLLFVD